MQVRQIYNYVRVCFFLSITVSSHDDIGCTETAMCATVNLKSKSTTHYLRQSHKQKIQQTWLNYGTRLVVTIFTSAALLEHCFTVK